MSQNKIFRLISCNVLSLHQRKWFSELSDAKIYNILNEYYIRNDKEEKINNVEKGQLGENKIEDIFIKYDIPYVRTSSTPHSGDFICYNKIMIDSKNYKNNITKDQIDKLSYDMNIRKINNGIILVFTDSVFKFELKNNIVILYVSSKNDEYIWMYLEIFLNYINMLPDHLDGDITCIDSDINISLQNYDNILTKLENMKNNFNIIVNELYRNNNKLKETINNSLYVKTKKNILLNDIHCDDLIKKIISNINYTDMSVNLEKILIVCKYDIKLLFNYKKKKEITLFVMNINNDILNNISSDLFVLMNYMSININSTQLTISFDYMTNKDDELIKILNKILNK